MSDITHPSSIDMVFPGRGEMAQLMRSHDWSTTSLGPVEHWPQSLRTTVSILLSTRHPMVLFWGKDRVQFYNDGYRPSLGAHKHPQALGQRAEACWTDIWHIIGPQIQGVMTRGEETWHEDQLVPFDRNGYVEEIYFTYSYSPVRDETGGVGGTLVVCTETTQQVLNNRRLQTLRDLATRTGDAKTAEAACTIAATTLSQNLADLPFALLYLLDEKGKHAHLAGISGLKPDTPASPSGIDLTAPAEVQAWPLATVLRTHQAECVNQITERFGGLPVGPWPEVPHTALVVPVASPGQEQPAGFLVAGISARRALDDPYRGFLDLVAGQIANAIADARAYEAERQRAEALADIDRAKTLFFSNISHEFRTPLTLLLAPLEDVLADSENPLPPCQRDRIEVVQRNGRRLLKLVNALLDVSRIETGRIQASYEPTDLSTLTADLSSTFRTLIEQAGLTLVVDCPPLSESIYVDQGMWETIVLNLLSNAFKFTLAGSIAVRLRDCADHVELAIADTGIGISSEDLPHLFERFRQAKGTQGRSFEGSGIGLSLVRELVSLHQGSIHVASQPGQGSCITLSIPKGFAHLPAQQVRLSQAHPSLRMSAMSYVDEARQWLPSVPSQEKGWIPDGSVPGSTYASCPLDEAIALPRILVVDDNADMQDYLKHLLENRYRIGTAADGLDALVQIQQQPPDLVLTDIMMPRLDGFGLLQALRADPVTGSLPVILLSARAGEEARIEGLQAGADDYLIKPFSSRELIARIEGCLRMAQIRKQAAVNEQALRLTAEEAMQRTDEVSAQLAQVLETMSDAFTSLDKDWRITYQNAAAERINGGKPRSQVIGKTHWEQWPHSVGTELERQYRRAVADQVPVHFEYRYYEPPAHDVWMEIHAYPFQGGLGIFFHDITARKQAEQALQESQHRLQQQLAEIEAIYRSAPIGLNVIDADLRFVRINELLAEINGLPVEAHLGRTVREVLPDLADTAEPLLRSILETGEPILNLEISGETLAQPGVQRTWLESFFPLKDGDRVIGISTVCQEITERKRVEVERQQAEQSLRQAKAELEVHITNRTIELQQTNERLQQELVRRSQIEKQLRQSEARYRAIVEDQTEMIVRFAPDTTIRFVNGAYCRYFGTRQEDVIGKSYNPVIYEADREKVSQLVQSMNVRNPVVIIENRVVSATGEVRWTQWVNRMLFDPDENLIEFQSVGRDITALKDIEQALRQSKERLRLALEASGDGIWDWDIGTGEIYYSPQYFQMLGYAPDELPQTLETWYSLVHPDDLVWVRDLLEAHFKDSTVRYEFDYRLRTKAGDWKWIADYGKVVMWDEAGNPSRMIGTHRDVNERKQIEAALRLSEEQRRLALDLTHVGFWDLHIPSQDLTWNENHFSLLGLPPSSVKPEYKDWRDRLHPEDVDRVERLFFESIETHTDYEAEYRVIYPDDSIHWLLSRGRAVYDEQNQPLRSLGVLLDISDRKYIEASLQESDRRWRSLLDNVQLVVIGLDMNGNIEYANPFFLEMAGYSIEEVVGKYWFDHFLPPSQKPTLEITFQEVLEQNLHTHYQNLILTKTGEERMIAWTNTILRGVSGRAIGVIAIGEDITERYKVERMKAEFISVVSHELRTPLTSMQAALSLLSEKIIDPLSAEGEATIQIATEGTDRLVRLVNDILDLERLESGKIRFDNQPHDIAELVDTAVAQMQKLANQEKVTLIATCASFDLEVDGDRLLQVLTNLLSNAIKFSPSHSTVQLSVERQQPSNNAQPELLFTIRDQGRGIPVDKLESIFDRFQQVDASDSRQKGGTGLGLAICRSIIQQCGGTIWVESCVGQGSTFYFTLPIGRSQEPEAEQ